MFGEATLCPFVALIAVSAVETVVQSIEVSLLRCSIIGGICFNRNAFCLHFLFQVAQISYQCIGRKICWCLCLKNYHCEKCRNQRHCSLHFLTSSTGKLVVCVLLLLFSSVASCFSSDSSSCSGAFILPAAIIKSVNFCLYCSAFFSSYGLFFRTSSGMFASVLYKPLYCGFISKQCWK